MRRRALSLLLVGAMLAAAILAGCGSDSGSGDTTGGGGSDRLVVLGASSLTAAVTEYGESFDGAEVKTSFAGSDELAAQIQQGAKADVFASADTEYPAELFKEGLVEKPQVFAANELVIAVLEGSDIKSLSDLSKPDVKLVIGDPNVPVGSYTRTVLRRLPTAEREAIMGNVVSEETEVASIVAKLEQGAADAGIVYVTDEKAAEGLEPVSIPAKLQPKVEYGVAVVSSSGNKLAAGKFVAGLIEGEGQEDLRAAGFLPPP
ncbi:MAG TPA: molybdate ABC transporter substrate-binding protein [Solirubrobacterales bacterium]|nr:molybdate ABC transporter substrate-binding protein [Solirubrobacterales bacterium]